MALKTIVVILATSFYCLMASAETEIAILASGYFWCTQSDLNTVPGVTKTTVGYVGGLQANPTYKTVSSGETNYAEGVKVEFDNTIVSYAQQLDYFWTTTDPTVKDQQFCNAGKQYRSSIFYLNDQEQALALASRDAIEKKFPIVYTLVEPATTFYPAEEYHQEYYKKPYPL